MFCKNCGKEVDGNFCQNCGAPVSYEKSNKSLQGKSGTEEPMTKDTASQTVNRGFAKPYLYGRVFGKGPTADYTNKLRKTKDFLIILCVILLASVIALSFSLSKHLENEGLLETLLDNEIQTNKELRDKQSANLSAEEKADFLDENIAFCVDDDYVYYHTYDCDDFKNCDRYIAYNVYQAEAKDYAPCPKCH